MLDPLQNSASAVRALTRGLALGAHNIANVLTKDFTPSRAVYEEREGGGVEFHAEEIEGAEVDLVEGALNQVSTNAAIEANLKLARSLDKTLGVLLDVQG